MNPGCASGVHIQGPQAALRGLREAQQARGALWAGSFPEERPRESGLQAAGGCREPDWMLHPSERLLCAGQAPETALQEVGWGCEAFQTQASVT